MQLQSILAGQAQRLKGHTDWAMLLTESLPTCLVLESLIPTIALNIFKSWAGCRRCKCCTVNGRWVVRWGYLVTGCVTSSWQVCAWRCRRTRKASPVFRSFCSPTILLLAIATRMQWQSNPHPFQGCCKLSRQSLEQSWLMQWSCVLVFDKSIS